MSNVENYSFKVGCVFYHHILARVDDLTSSHFKEPDLITNFRAFFAKYLKVYGYPAVPFATVEYPDDDTLILTFMRDDDGYIKVTFTPNGVTGEIYLLRGYVGSVYENVGMQRITTVEDLYDLIITA